MGKVVRDLVEYNGIDICSYEAMASFKQMNADYIFCIPDSKPDVEQVVRVWVSSCVTESKVVKTPVGTSYEGNTVTGNKLLVSGDIYIKIQYVACNKVSTVHTAHTTVPFSGYVVLPANINANSFIEPSVIIEDVFTEQIDCRCIYNNITFIIAAYSC